MITTETDRIALNRIQRTLSVFAPRLTRKVYDALREILYRELGVTLIRHFLCCRAPKAPAVPGTLTLRTGNLYNSVLRSLQIGEHGNRLVVTIGSNLPYSTIHEYGGRAGRRGAYIPPRPYLRPTMSDLEGRMPEFLELAMRQVDPILLVKDSQ